MQPAKQRFSLKQSLRLTNSMYLCHLQLPSFQKQTNIVWVDFFSSKNKSSWVFAPKKKTKCITAEKLFFYLGQYKFEAYSVFKYKHVCYLFSLRKQYKTCKISVGKNWHTKLQTGHLNKLLKQDGTIWLKISNKITYFRKGKGFMQT